MENNIQNELGDQVIRDDQQYENEVDPREDDETDEDELDLGDADGSGGELEGGGDDLDD